MSILLKTLTALLALSFIPSTGLAYHPTHGGVDRLARHDVREMASTRRGSDIWRGIAGESLGTPFLAIERLERRGSKRARVTLQRQLDSFSYGGGALTFRGQAQEIHSLEWSGRKLTFAVETESERLQCHVKVRGKRAFRARCSPTQVGQGNDGYYSDQPAPIVHQTNWASVPSVIAACGDAFYGGSSQSACLDTVKAFRYNPAPVIAACDKAMYGSTSTLACVRKASRAWADPSQRLQACDAAVMGSSAVLKCFDHANKASYEPSRVIAQCDKSMIGTTNTLACIATAVRADRDVAATVRVCDESMMGSSAVLSCLQRGVSF